jgi:hypothetical protein
MTRISVLLALLAALAFNGHAAAAEFNGVTLPDSYNLEGQTLHLNAQGLPSKFFFSIYVGALCTATRVTSASQAMRTSISGPNRQQA